MNPFHTPELNRLADTMGRASFTKRQPECPFPIGSEPAGHYASALMAEHVRNPEYWLNRNYIEQPLRMR